MKEARMPAYLILAVLVAILAVVFAVQNAVPVTVAFLNFDFASSLALVLLVTFGLGMITGFLGLLPTIIRGRRQLAVARRELKERERGGKKETGGEDLPARAHDPIK